MEIEMVSKETIKPLSATPAELRHFHLCSFDRKAPNFYLHFLYFYNNGSSGGSQLLKESLSKTLTFYYPFAGRLTDHGFVDCNDMGVAFLEAKLSGCRMSEIMNTSDLQRDEISKLVCCDDMTGKDQRVDPLLSVQLTQFEECGGEVISVFLSHKLVDTSTFVNFMNDWASIARSSYGDRVSLSVLPQFNAASYFPSDGLPIEQEFERLKQDKNIVSTKRFMFKNSKIAALKASVISKKVETNPSRVQVVSSLIYKAAAASSAMSTPTFLMQIIDLRSRVVPPLPSTLTGNIVSFFIASSTTSKQKEENAIEVSNLVGDMKRNMEEFCNKYPKKYKDVVEDWDSLYQVHLKESMEKMSNPKDQVGYMCSSWCGAPFYEADFGWGKPLWITPNFTFKDNVFVLMDAKDGDGIEAYVCLERNQMAVFEHNEELLSSCELKT